MLVSTLIDGVGDTSSTSDTLCGSWTVGAIVCISVIGEDVIAIVIWDVVGDVMSVPGSLWGVKGDKGDFGDVG